MDEVSIRNATAADLRQVYALVKDLAAFEQEPDEPSVGYGDFERDFGAGYDCIVAECAGKIIGMALYFWGYSTWKGKMLYLDDLIVREEFRGRRIGSALFNKIMERARAGQAGQVRWQVLDWNEPAIRMYKKADADFYANWLTCKLERERIKNYSDI